MVANQHYSLYLEYSILHTIINNGYGSLEQILLILRNEDKHFYNENHRVLYRLIIEMYQSNKDLNQVTIYEMLNRKITSPALVKKIFDGISRGEILADLREPGMQLIDYSIKRELIEVGSNIKMNNTDTGFNILTELSKVVQNITETYLPSNVVDMNTIQGSALAMVLKAKEFRDKGEFPGIPTGFYKLDENTGGLKPGSVTILAARPSMGKTAFALSAALNASSKYPIAFFSLEMDRETLLLRLVAQYAKIDLAKLLNGDIHEHQIELIKTAMDQIKANHSIIIDDDPMLDTVLLRAKIRRYIQQYGVKAVFIDYLQLMQTKKGQNREREIAEVSSTIKHIAREYKIPIVILAQLNRDLEHRADKRPMLADLRESGSIEQDADLVLFLYRPEIYGMKQYPSGEDAYNTCQVIIGKQRNGALGNVILTYVKEYTGFYNYIAAGILPATNHAPFEEKLLSDDVPF